MPTKPSLSASFASATKQMKETGSKKITVVYGEEKKETKKPASKAPAKKQSPGGIVDAKAKGSSIKPKAGEMAKKSEASPKKKEMSAKQEAKVSRLAQKKEKLRAKGESAAKSGDQTRAKRLRERYDRKTERIKKVSK